MGRFPSRRLARWGALLFLLALPVLSGCSAKTAKIRGKVYYEKKLVKGGDVTFNSTEGKPSNTTRINSDGTYEIEAPTGNVVITVDTAALNPALRKGRTYEPPKDQKSPYGAGKNTATGEFTRIPERYADATKSPLTYTVKSGAQEKDLDLEPDPAEKGS